MGAADSCSVLGPADQDQPVDRTQDVRKKKDHSGFMAKETYQLHIWCS